MKSWFLLIWIGTMNLWWKFVANYHNDLLYFLTFFSKLAYDLVLSNSSMELWVSCKNFVNDSCFGYRNSSSCTRMFVKNTNSLLAWENSYKIWAILLKSLPNVVLKKIWSWKYIDGEEILSPPSFSNLEDVIALRKLLVKKSIFVFKSGCCV